MVFPKKGWLEVWPGRTPAPPVPVAEVTVTGVVTVAVVVTTEVTVFPPLTMVVVVRPTEIPTDNEM